MALIARRPRWLTCEKAAVFLFAATLSGAMSFVVSGIATVGALGLDFALVAAWLRSWLVAWITALPIVIILAPRVQRMVRAVLPRLLDGCG